MTSRSASTPLATLVLLLLGISSVANAQLSRPIARDDHLARDADANKYLDREAKPDAHDDELAAIPRDVCPANLRLRWQTEVSSSVYATPVITLSASSTRPTFSCRWSPRPQHGGPCHGLAWP